MSTTAEFSGGGRDKDAFVSSNIGDVLPLSEVIGGERDPATVLKNANRCSTMREALVFVRGYHDEMQQRLGGVEVEKKSRLSGVIIQLDINIRVLEEYLDDKKTMAGNMLVVGPMKENILKSLKSLKEILPE